jgi:hypothetical protein
VRAAHAAVEEWMYQRRSEKNRTTYIYSASVPAMSKPVILIPDVLQSPVDVHRPSHFRERIIELETSDCINEDEEHDVAGNRKAPVIIHRVFVLGSRWEQANSPSLKRRTLRQLPPL